MTFVSSLSFCKGKFCLAARIGKSITQFAANELLFCKASRQKHAGSVWHKACVLKCTQVYGTKLLK